jgi:hypothetical protein
MQVTWIRECLKGSETACENGEGEALQVNDRMMRPPRMGDLGTEQEQKGICTWHVMYDAPS